jgi:ABC-type cobalt transport system substrate-binding protein
MAIGIMLIVLGVETLFIESANLYAASDASARNFIDPGMTPARTTKVWEPGEKFPWAMLAIGAIIVLYAITLPKRWRRHD